jgi:hypothetical protein
MAVIFEMKEAYQISYDPTTGRVQHSVWENDAWSPYLVLDKSMHSVPGATAGTINYTMPDQGITQKTVIIELDGYENDTANSQSITFPVAFVNTPAIIGNTSGLTPTLSTTEATFDPDAATVYSGVIVLMGN